MMTMDEFKAKGFDKKIPEFLEKYLNKAFSTEGINKDSCEKYIKLVCSLDDEYPKDFKIKYLDSPLALQYYITLYSVALEKNMTINELKSQTTVDELYSLVEKNLSYVGLSYYSDFSNYVWVSFYKFFEEIGFLDNDLFKNYSDLFLESNLYQFAKLPDEVVVCRKPLELYRDSENRLHSYNSPAVLWADGFKQYFIKGIEVPSSWVEDKVTIKDIEESQNAELRRIALEIYGEKTYLFDSGAEKIASDQWGELWKKEIEDDEPIVVLSVYNSTPESEENVGLEQRLEFRETELGQRGQWYKKYLFRVPPDCVTPLQALAWYANVTEEEYLTLVKET